MGSLSVYPDARATMKASKIMVRERYRGALNEDLDRGDLTVTPSSGVPLTSHMMNEFRKCDCTNLWSSLAFKQAQANAAILCFR